MEAEYAAAYPMLYRQHWWWRARETILLDAIQRLTGLKRTVRILDVGCGAALFFDALERFGDVEGIESDALSVAQSGRWQHRIVTGELNDSYRPNRPFDVILLLDVLEHVHDPSRLLRRAGEILAPDGSILITVPAFKLLWTAHDEINHHLRRYRATELKHLIEVAGLTVIDARYIFQSLVIAKFLAKTKELIAGRRPSVPRIPPTPINRVLQWWYQLEHHAIGSLPFGGSVLAVAARSVRRLPRPL
jgi:2-polyprenyl-3-methyl-5-hydroxy-6-metoxy-1,4-benzoquinol methylase